jgi:hypothetical protein
VSVLQNAAVSECQQGSFMCATILFDWNKHMFIIIIIIVITRIIIFLIIIIII